MRIKRIFAADMREAIRKVRDQHGPEAVVISSRKVEGGVEVISAIDYDEKAVQAAARAQEPAAAEIPPLDVPPGPRPGAPDDGTVEPAVYRNPAAAEAAGLLTDEAERARQAALARLRQIRSGAPVPGIPPALTREASADLEGAARRASAMEGSDRPVAAGVAESARPRIDLRVGGEEDDDRELFSALSRDHRDALEKRDASRRKPAAPAVGGQAAGAAARFSAMSGGKRSGGDAGATPKVRKSGAARATVNFSDESAIQEMREEIRTLRSLFENQLTLMEWSRMGRRHPARASVIKRLADLGLGSDVSRRLADHVRGDEDPDAAYRKALALIARYLPVTNDEIVTQGGVVALVGPTGVGKTTTVAKLAARYALRHGRERVALISTDNYRIGAQDQLLTYARILDVPVYTASNRHELRTLLDDLVDRGLVLIDTVGMSQRDVRLAEQFKTLGSAEGLVRTYLVLSAATQLSTLTESVRAFRAAEPAGCILTKLDEATTLGGILTCALRTRLPLAYLGVGQRVPEDLQAARGDTLVHKACALLEEFGQNTDEEAVALSLGGGGHVFE